MTPMETKSPRRVPRIVVIVIPLVALGVILALLSFAWRANSEVRTERSPEPGPSASLATAGSSFLGCTDCHGDLDKVFKEGGAPTLKYTHERHFATGVSDCSVCHPGETHAADTINLPTMSRCFMCHGTTKAAIAPGECAACHPKGMPDKPPTHLVSDWVPKQHAKLANEDQFQCLTCHKESFCASCHGLEIPHPEGWAQEAHTVAFFEDPQTCQRCHVRAVDAPDFCDTCHHQRNLDQSWRQVHPGVVTERGAFDCFQCHNPATCSACHVGGEENFEADQGYEPQGYGPSVPAPSPSG